MISLHLLFMTLKNLFLAPFLNSLLPSYDFLGPTSSLTISSAIIGPDGLSRSYENLFFFRLKPHLTEDSAVVVDCVYPAPFITGIKVRSQYYY